MGENVEYPSCFPDFEEDDAECADCSFRDTCAAETNRQMKSKNWVPIESSKVSGMGIEKIPEMSEKIRKQAEKESSDNTSRVRRSWPITIGFFVAGLIALGIALELGMTLWGVAFAILAFYLLTGTFVAVNVTCPNGHKLWFVTGVTWCENCHDYYRKEKSRLVPIEPGFIAPFWSSRFEARRSDLLNRQLKWPWRCCVCGAEPTRVEIITWYFIGYPREEVPHCSKHKNGAYIPTHNKCIEFRSYDYLREFMRLNSR